MRASNKESVESVGKSTKKKSVGFNLTAQDEVQSNIKNPRESSMRPSILISSNMSMNDNINGL